MITPDQFDYHLPDSYIAQAPSSPRDAAKLMIVDRQSKTLSHRIFKDLLEILTPNDVLVLNDSKVFPARLLGKKESGGHAEVLLLRPIDTDTWEAMSNGLKTSQIVQLGKSLTGHVISKDKETGHIQIKLESQGKSVTDSIYEIGHTPIPPYIKTPLAEQILRAEYQTVYADEAGSAAAPTAGMHFTAELLDQLKDKGIQIEYVTLHVGPGTFAKLRPEQVESKTLHTEWYEIKPDVTARLNQAKQNGKRIIAVGTTSCRTLESACGHSGHHSTSIFIMPGYQFKFVDALITNFHLPKSSLLMLVTAFTNDKYFHGSLIEKAYLTAIESNYRFFSFGDAMLII